MSKRLAKEVKRLCGDVNCSGYIGEEADELAIFYRFIGKMIVNKLIQEGEIVRRERPSAKYECFGVFKYSFRKDGE